MPIYQGSCECQSVKFEVSGELSDITACHCYECRKSSGNYWAYTEVMPDQINFLEKDDLGWYDSTDLAIRGFCKNCGSTLFWRLKGREEWHISASSFDDPIPVKLTNHIFVTERGSFYEITDGLPQAARFE